MPALSTHRPIVLENVIFNKAKAGLPPGQTSRSNSKGASKAEEAYRILGGGGTSLVHVTSSNLPRKQPSSRKANNRLSSGDFKLSIHFRWAAERDEGRQWEGEMMVY